MKLNNGIEFFTGNIPGYGWHGVDYIKVVYDNRTLEYQQHENLRAFGAAEVLLKQKWEQYTEQEVRQLANDKELASPVCHACGQGTIYGGGSSHHVWQGVFCDKPQCLAAMEVYRAEEKKKYDAAMAKMEEESKEYWRKVKERRYPPRTAP